MSVCHGPMIHVVPVCPTPPIAVTKLSSDPNVEEVEIPYIVKKSYFSK